MQWCQIACFVWSLQRFLRRLGGALSFQGLAMRDESTAMAVSHHRFGCSSTSSILCHSSLCYVGSLFSSKSKVVEIGSVSRHNRGSLQKPMPICGVVQQDRSYLLDLFRLRQSISKTSSARFPSQFFYIFFISIYQFHLSQRHLIWGFYFLSLQVTFNPTPLMAEQPTFKQVVAQVFQSQDARPT